MENEDESKSIELQERTWKNSSSEVIDASTDTSDKPRQLVLCAYATDGETDPAEVGVEETGDNPNLYLEEEDAHVETVHNKNSWSKLEQRQEVLLDDINAEELDKVIEEEISREEDDTLILRVKHVLRNGQAFEDHDHQRVLKTLAKAQPLSVYKHDVAPVYASSVALWDVAMYASGWRDFASCVSTSQSRNKKKEIIFYKIANDGAFDLKKLKKNREVMDCLRGLEVFIFVDNFQREATKDAGFFIGLHSRLTNWDNLRKKSRLHSKTSPAVMPSNGRSTRKIFGHQFQNMTNSAPNCFLYDAKHVNSNRFNE